MATIRNSIQTWARRPAAWLVVALLSLFAAATLSSCGGGALALAALGGVGTGGTGLTIGSVVAFGSVGVDGQEYDSEKPQYYQNSPASPTAAAAVGLGDWMRVATAGNNPLSMTVEPSLIGAAQSIGIANADGTGTFFVNGVRVVTNFNAGNGPITFYVGLNKFSDLTPNMRVEVHGLFGVDGSGGYIQATRIVQLPSPSSASATVSSQITGMVTQLGTDAIGTTFTIGGTLVQCTPATTLLTSGVPLAVGQVVTVSGIQPFVNGTAGGTITAATLRIHSLVGVDGTVQVEGLLATGAGSATGSTTGSTAGSAIRYTLDGIPLDLSASGLLSASNPSWVPGAAYVLTGQVDATGTLHVSAVRAYRSAPAQVRIKGTITGYVSNSNFLVRGVPVNVPPNVAMQPATSVLGNGVYVEILGNPGGIGQGDEVIATAVTASTTPPSGATVDYLGTVTEYQAGSAAGSGTFTLNAGTGVNFPNGVLKLQITLANATYVNGTAADLAVSGASVEVEGTWANGALTAYSVTFLGSPALGTSGSIEDWNPATRTFTVHDLTLTVDTATTSFWNHTFSPPGSVPGWFENGARVAVQYRGTVAQTISLENLEN